MERTLLLVLCMVPPLIVQLAATKCQGKTSDNIKNVMKALRDRCQGQCIVSTDAIDGICEGKFPEDNEELKCYCLCVLNTMGCMKDGKFDAAGGKQKMKQLPKDVKQPLTKGLNKCKDADKGTKSAGDSALAVVKCVYYAVSEGEDRGFHHLKLNTMKNIAACKQEHNASREDYDAIRKSQTPSSEEGQCFLACLFNKFQVMENGKYSAETFRKRVAELYEDDSDKLQKAIQMVNECETTLREEIAPNKCRYAVKVLECIASYTSKVEVIKDLLKYQKIKSS